MDIGVLAALGLLLFWAIGAFIFDAPGWIHLFLSLGMFVLMWRIVTIRR